MSSMRHRRRRALARQPAARRGVRALADGGVTVVEITMTVPDALDVVRGVRQALGDRLLLGAGTILDPETARAALLAGRNTSCRRR